MPTPSDPTRSPKLVAMLPALTLASTASTQDPRDPCAWGDFLCRPVPSSATFAFVPVGNSFFEPWKTGVFEESVEFNSRFGANAYNRVSTNAFTYVTMTVCCEPVSYHLRDRPQDSLANLWVAIRDHPANASFLPIAADYRMLFASKAVWMNQPTEEEPNPPNLGGVSLFGAPAGSTSATGAPQTGSGDNVHHEGSHTLLFGHAQMWHSTDPCDPEGPGSTQERGDYLDPVGSARPKDPETGAPIVQGVRHWNPYFKYLLGILDHDEIFWLPTDGTHTIDLLAIEQDPAGRTAGQFAAAVIPKSPTESYWIFYRSHPTTGAKAAARR